MRDAEMFDGFDPKKQQEHEKYMLDTGVLTQQQIDEVGKGQHIGKSKAGKSLKTKESKLIKILLMRSKMMYHRMLRMFNR